MRMELKAGAALTMVLVLSAVPLAGQATENPYSMASPNALAQPHSDGRATPAFESAPDRPTIREKRICFPPDPPPLGAQINFDEHTGTTVRLPRELAANAGEVFYPPLSTCLLEFADGPFRHLRPRVEAYERERETLLAELRATLAGLVGATPDERLTRLTALAQKQEAALTELEAQADDLRRDMARHANWYDRRQWKLGAGPLRDRRPEHAMLEYQVVRAAAFYQDGLLPAQRRLLREAAMELQDEMSPDATDRVPGVPIPSLVFFSPDGARLLPPADLPAGVRELLDAYVADKDALRGEVRDTVIAADRAMFATGRRGACEKLARRQRERLTALDERAEAIRRAYAPVFARHRRPAPPALPPELAGMIDEYEQGKREFSAGLEEQVQHLLETRGRPAAARANSGPGVPGRLQADPAVEQLKKIYLQEHRAELIRLTNLLQAIHLHLEAAVGAAQVDPMTPGSDAFLMRFMRDYRSEHAYSEYEIAVWEPGLAPAQRRLLLNGAVVRLDLPLPRPERQPSALPFTLVEPGAL